MADYLPKAEQLDTMNAHLAELNEHLQKREDFTTAMAKLDSATQKAESLADGFSPTATVTQTSTGADISVTDKNGTTNAHIENGSDANVTKENVVSALGYTPLESAPVTSVNGKTGAVEIAASDVGAISSADGSVQNAHLASGAVTTGKLAEAERMTSANIVGALGYEPEEKSGEWKLIEEITVENGVRNYDRTQEPDGTAYAFKCIYIICTSPADGMSASTVGIFRATFSDGNSVYNYASGAFPTAKSGKSTQLISTDNNGMVEMRGQTVYTGGNWEANAPKTCSRLVTPGAVITKLSNYVSSDSAAGATFTIYGIRA